NETALRQCLIVPTRVLTTAYGPILQVTEFHTEHGGLQAVQSAVDAFEVVIVFFRSSVVREHPGSIRPLLVVGDERTAIAVSAKVFPRIETERGDVGELRDRLSFVL